MNDAYQESSQMLASLKKKKQSASQSPHLKKQVWKTSIGGGIVLGSIGGSQTALLRLGGLPSIHIIL